VRCFVVICSFVRKKISDLKLKKNSIFIHDCVVRVKDVKFEIIIGSLVC
jgi:hypothetical protein